MKFLNRNSRLQKSLKESENQAKQNPNRYTAKDNILRKYGLNLSIWNFIEIIEFGNFIKFCEFYYKKYPNDSFFELKTMLWSVKCLRNSSAHNNCLINNLNVFDSFQPNIDMKNYLKNVINLPDRPTNKKLKNPFIYDFLVAILLFDKICNSKKMKFHFYKEIINLFNGRIKRNKIYYKNNALLTSSYEYVVRFLIFMVKTRLK